MKSLFDPVVDAYDALKGVLYSDIGLLTKLTRDAYVHTDTYALGMGCLRKTC